MTEIERTADHSIDSVPAQAGGHWLRRRVLARFAGLAGGRLEIRDAGGRVILGRDSGDDSLAACIRVRNAAFWRMLATGGALGAGEAYELGLWDSDDLVAVIRLLARNRDLLTRLDGPAARVGGAVLRLAHRFNRNTIAGSRRNIARHYDLGNEFFGQWLDSRMQYSSGLYESPNDSLDQAQQRKLERICRQLDLGPDDHLLEVGCGWGGLAVYAAAETGCRVTAVTISQRQFEYARRLVDFAGLGDQVEIRLQDYRQVQGRFDKLVSVEMIEAVGADHLDEYMRRIGELLEPGGRALIQAITIEDYRYRRALRHVDYIKRHIFPGSFIPSVSAITDAMARTGDLGLVDLVDLGSSYAETLKAWRERFEQRWPAIRRLGFDRAFRLRWHYYLSYCEGGFRERAISDVQMLFSRPGMQSASGLAVGRA